MKKLLSLLLCIAMLVTLGITAIGETEKAAPAQGGEPMKVALCVAETLGDLGFYDSANEGLKSLEKDYGVVGSVVECKSDASAYQPALVEAAEQNDIVVAVGWQFWDGLSAVVPEMPETLFIFVDNGLEGVGDNLLSITYAENQGSFLAGYIAMKMAKSGTVGVIGGENSDTINNFIVGYKQGALYANPEGTVLDPVYTDDYEAPDKGKEAALSLYSKGADVVFPVAGKTGLGVFEAAQEQGKYAIGVDSDQKHVNPEVILCSMLKQVGNSIYDAVSMYLEDSVFNGGTIWNADISSGLVAIGYGDETMTQQVPDELKAEVEALKLKISSGEIVVESTR
ncbi:MAG: BMP family ABC transporter substrate-binding protein [Clostridia bacterium]